MFQHDGQSADARHGSENQMHRPSHSLSGPLQQQSVLLPADTNVGCTSVPAGLAEHVALQQSVEGVGETGLLQPQAAAVTHTSSGSSSCEMLDICYCVLLAGHLLYVFA